MGIGVEDEKSLCHFVWPGPLVVTETSHLSLAEAGCAMRIAGFCSRAFLGPLGLNRPINDRPTLIEFFLKTVNAVEWRAPPRAHRREDNRNSPKSLIKCGGNYWQMAINLVYMCGKNGPCTAIFN